jgi:hypothetical protein
MDFEEAPIDFQVVVFTQPIKSHITHVTEGTDVVGEDGGK